jgi:hypothetical protein
LVICNANQLINQFVSYLLINYRANVGTSFDTCGNFVESFKEKELEGNFIFKTGNAQFKEHLLEKMATGGECGTFGGGTVLLVNPVLKLPKKFKSKSTIFCRLLQEEGGQGGILKSLVAKGLNKLGDQIEEEFG